MAKATVNGSTTVSQWEKVEHTPDNTVRSVYGFRSDGVLLRRASYKPTDGRRAFADNWSVAKRGVSYAKVAAFCERLGYKEV